MRFSQLYAPTLRENPADAEIPSQALLQRAGFIRKIAAGVYTYLPLARRTLLKIENIVREEMDRIGAQEILMPIIQPAELWIKSGRWDDYGPEMMKLKDRHNRDFTLGPTHEELVTELVKNELNSYKQLPVTLYQIANKYRDEIRPRFGVLRAREFIMKDAYSFHDSWESLDEVYKKFKEAYSRILERIGLRYTVIEASSGAIGGKESHEFVAFAEYGESNILYCDCGYAGSDEKVPYMGEYEVFDEDEKERELVHTPNVRTVEEVAQYLGVEIKRIVKSLIFKGRDGYVMVLVPGNRELNFEKLKAYLGDQSLQMALPENILEDFGVPIGFLGPVGISNVKIVADKGIKYMKNFVVGGMKKNYHYINVNLERDFQVEEWADLVVVNPGEPCPVCGKPLKSERGIELGHIFKLGTKYSETMDVKYMNKDGKMKPFIMGCYGWGISRTLGAIVEQLHDDNGIIWPVSVAPYEVVITVVGKENEKSFAEKLYRYLLDKGVDVLIDDRDVSPGVKFKDADLIGFPLRITIGKSYKDGKVELKERVGNVTIIEADEEVILKNVQHILKR
ncbi:prolyl-tRNA synthetase [Thermosipho melanesiensis]|uniref:Proline--tRNA ligase n=2 Tax=Thermosipho melanesiensis TaxID=46541 RepID=SYP_THEM4|nr:proline--tRNA ligase [Thermosipho melanesiensis]A6LJ40.1 RecName: Full=Proline--tRNA ligase; AltName: Full=Prolyl-tRNA synthetase; Short=ProRS [Thermosipho melanesiensis BI429]ABR29941.1 prolyl-tRNA synthetase [Thermosipho melanesiensis BI429]APT73149.1 prolyl-tRNA synthetase [Thermosipho melanesiensis]OOC38545.1 prolyl-tRNA synthetase [Thermosipho melanesiensis]OOC40349.1 prolyl-tRNA synthetase [Thermosipho melanesiensis]OOC40613.1 prolyl-tRNA synthetase [Thermosipho melanesiensis]